MKIFPSMVQRLPEFEKAVNAMKITAPYPTMITSLSHIHKAHFLSGLCDEGIKKPVLVLAETEAECQRLVEDINTMTRRTAAYLYPVKDITLTPVDVVSREYEHKRLDVLTKLLSGECEMVVCCPEAAAQLTIPPDVLSSRTIELSPDDEIVLEQLIKSLIAAGFTRCDMIEGRSQFSVRGSIIDIFPINMSYPVRIELWGDSVDTISTFDLETQRRTDTIKKLRISPSMELLFINDQILCEKIEYIIQKQEKSRAKNKNEKAAANLRKDLDYIKNHISLTNLDKYFPLAYEREVTVLDYVDSVILCESFASMDNLRGAVNQHQEDIKFLFEEGVLCRGLDRYMLTRGEFIGKLEQKCRLYMDTFMRGGDIKLSEMANINGIQLSPWGGEHKLLEEDLRNYMDKGYSCIIFAGTEKAAKTLADDLREDGFSADFSTNPKKLFAKKTYVIEGTISAGFEYPDSKLACFTHTAVTTTVKTAPVKKRKKGEEIRSLTDISIGDLVVHYSYGIGVFEGVQKLTSDKISKDYIKIRYAGTDVLYVPVTQLDLLSRYIGSGDANTIKLNKINSDQWVKAKTKAKTAAKEMATELIELYSKRMRAKGYAFSPDSEDQHRFENHFNYIETDDQLKCAEEIKQDMERTAPMERLLCGDVGFGKTEVALRGAFKCIADGKQCALLVPTTVLAWQHYQTVLKRMEEFNIKVELLSRFRSPKEQKIILKKLYEGDIDIIIGTHRLVQDDVKFFDLGLVIIDEEQRFGVAHKEKFKESFNNVDILTLSATPIPRTLNMAMSNIRDMSVIETPPQDRHPITTYVIEQDWSVIAQAITKELRRNGQVYYIHNRIESIYSCAARIQQLIPEAVIGVAHGKMNEEQLLEVWRKLIEGDIDILVCTTLIETGVDVPNVNTLIIENADYMGLAQLHQLRGRVGRTNKRAFAYFTFKRGKVLSEIATKRLNAIREFTQFGSGFRIAMRDLEIRGAGSILGSSQSGHLATVGYDMYLQLLNEAVMEEQGQTPEVKNECLVDIKINAFIPETYISNQAQRIDCYRKIAMIETEDDSFDVIDELIDRYGDLPEAVEGLIEVAQLRSMAQRAGITEIIQNADSLVFYTPKPDMEKVAKLTDKFKFRLMLNLTGKVNFKITLGKNENPLSAMREILEEVN